MSDHFCNHIRKLDHGRKVEIAHQLLKIAKSRGGTDLKSCVTMLHEAEQQTLGVITGLSNSRDRTFGEKLDMLIAFLLANPLPVTSTTRR